MPRVRDEAGPFEPLRRGEERVADPALSRGFSLRRLIRSNATVKVECQARIPLGRRDEKLLRTEPETSGY